MPTQPKNKEELARRIEQEKKQASLCLAELQGVSAAYQSNRPAPIGPYGMRTSGNYAAETAAQAKAAALATQLESHLSRLETLVSWLVGQHAQAKENERIYRSKNRYLRGIPQLGSAAKTAASEASLFLGHAEALREFIGESRRKANQIRVTTPSSLQATSSRLEEIADEVTPRAQETTSIQTPHYRARPSQEYERPTIEPPPGSYSRSPY